MKISYKVQFENQVFRAGIKKKKSRSLKIFQNLDTNNKSR